MDRYSIAVKTYGEVVAAAGGLEGAEFSQALRRAEQARATCHEAERAMQEHEQAHGCFRQFALRATA